MDDGQHAQPLTDELKQDSRIYEELPLFITEKIKKQSEPLTDLNVFIRETVGKSHVQTERLIENKLTEKKFPLVNTNERKPEFNKRKIHNSGLPKQKYCKSWSIKSLPEECRKYTLYQGLNEMWCQYMSELLKPCINNKEQTLSKLSKADLHGAIITVVDSICQAYISLKGMVLFESTNMLHFISPDNTVKVVPKKGSIFAIEWNGLNYYIYGNHWKVNPAGRATKKFKSKVTIELHKP